MRVLAFVRVFLLTILLGFSATGLWAQVPADSLTDPQPQDFGIESRTKTRVDTPPADSILQLDPDSVYTTTVPNSSGVLDYEVVYNAVDSMPSSLIDNVVELYNEGVVEYGDIKIEAGYIKIMFSKDEVYATGLPDSTGKITQKPVFTEQGKQYQADEMRYNFATKKARINKVITQEGEGFLHGEKVKMTGDKVLYIKNGSFTTCSHKDPHFSIITPRAKVIPGEKVVTQFAWIEVADVPTPLVVPFGFFPTTDKRKSGIIVPSYGNSEFRGYFLQNLGFYWAINDYLDATFTGDIYTQGGFGARASTNYKVRYKYSGGLNLSYNLLRYGEEEFEEFIPGSFNNSSDFAVTWRHRQDPKANPNYNFSANVNIATTQFYKITSVNPNQILQNRLNSSVSFTRTWQNKPYNLNIALNHSQNNQTGDLTLTLPNVNFSVNRFFPFRSERTVGNNKWYEEIGITYTVDGQNQITTNINEPIFTETVFRDSSRMGLRHQIPIQANYKLFNYIVFNPSINYTERWYPTKLEYGFDSTGNAVVVDTARGFFANRDFSIRTNFTTKLYGQWNYKGFFRALRHVMTPTVGFSFVPDFSDREWGFYERLTNPTTGETVVVNPYQGSLYGGPPAGRQGNLNFGVQNTLEAKVRSDKDSTGLKKIKLLERLSFNTSYNLAATQFNWAQPRLTATSSAFNGLLSFNYDATYDFYGFDPEQGGRVNQFAWYVNGKLLRTTRQNLALGFNLNANRFKRDGNSRGAQRNKQQNQQNQNEPPPDLGITEGDIDYYALRRYIDYNVPWNLNLTYTLTSNSPGGQAPVTSQSLSFNGDIDLTKGWRIGFSSGFDFEAQDFTVTTLDFYRDLHCWELRCTWVPIGFQQTYVITIQVKADMLSDLKLERRRGLGDFQP